MKEAGARGVVILGRNGALILGDIPTALHVQVDAPVEVRIARAAQEEGLDLAHAARRQRNEDWARAEMSDRFYYWNPMVSIATTSSSIRACSTSIQLSMSSLPRTRPRQRGLFNPPYDAIC